MARILSSFRPELGTSLVDPSQVDLTAQERWFLDFFLRAGSFMSAAYFYDEFWHKFLCPMGANAAVKHAGIALAASYLQIRFHHCGSHDECKKMKSLIWRQTNKSITHLLEQSTPQYISGKCGNREVVVTCATLFSLLSVFNNDLPTAQAHSYHGFEVMKEWRNSNFNDSATGTALSQALMNIRLKCHAYSNPSSFLQDDNPVLLHVPDLETFNNTSTRCAVDSFWIFWTWFMSMQQPTDTFSVDGNVDELCSGLHSAELSLMFKVRVWESLLSTYIRRTGDSAPESLHDALIFLRLLRQVMCIRVGAAVSAIEDPIFKPFEGRYGGLLVYFLHANELASELLQSLVRRKVSKPAFSIGAVLGLLFFCGFRCRDWGSRRVTLGLMQACMKRARHTANLITPVSEKLPAALERLIDIESEGLQPGNVVPESARIRSVRVTTACPGLTRSQLSYVRTGAFGFDENFNECL